MTSLQQSSESTGKSDVRGIFAGMKYSARPWAGLIMAGAVLATFVPGVEVAPASAAALTLTFETPNDDVVVLGDLASRTQRKPVTFGGSSAPYTVTGTDSRGGTYQYQTDVTTETNRESDERGFAPGDFTFGSTANHSYTDAAGEQRTGTMYLESDGDCNSGNTFGGLTTYCAVFGPEVWTEPFSATAGQALSFDYAASASDNYEVYAFLVKVSGSPGSYDYGGGKAENLSDPLDTHTLILHRRGKRANWTTASGSVPETGTYRFRFVDGAYDNSGGYALGTDFYIDPASVTVGNGQTITFSNPGDQVGSTGTFQLTASSSSGQTVTFTASGSSGCSVSGNTVTKSGTGSCVITANAAGGDVGGVTYVAASSVTRSFQILASATKPVNSGAPTIFGSPATGTTLTSDEGTWNTGGAPISATTYQWISTSSGTDTEITGATSSSFCISENLVGTTLKLRVTKTNSVGSTIAVSTPTTAVSAGSACPVVEAETNTGSQRDRDSEEIVAPSTPTVASTPRPAQTPSASGAPPALQAGPILRGGAAPIPPRAPSVLVGGRPTAVTTTVPNTSRLDVRAGAVNLGVRVQENQGQISQTTDGGTEIAVQKGAAATITGSGFRPGATVQVFMPLQGDNAKELTRIPVQPDGSFDGSAPFATRPNEVPLPIGKNVLQLVSLDNDGNQVVVEMAVNIAQGAPAPEQNRIDGVIPAMAPGQSVATSGGEPVPVRITPVAEQKLAVVEGDGWTMAVNVAAEDGGVEPSEGGALLKLVRDESAVISGSGFMPGTRADVWLFSDPTLLGTVTIDENGEFTGEVNIDPNMIPVGEHTLQLQGVGEDGYVKAANLGVLVDDPVEAAPTAVEQGLGFIWWIVAALVLLAVIVVLIASRRRRDV